MKTAVIFGVLLNEGEMDAPSRNQLMLALAEERPVVFLRKALRPGRPRIELLRENVYVMNDAFALRATRAGRKLVFLAAIIDGFWFRAALKRAGLTDYVFWLMTADPVLAAGIPVERLVYDCIDPNFVPSQQRRFDRDELALARKARVVFATANALYSRMRSVNDKTYRLPNAAPIDDSSDDQLPVPSALRDRPTPVVGYLGTIDWRFDADPIRAAAATFPDVTFAIVGRVNHDQATKLAPLLDLPNVIVPGAVGIAEGDAYVANFDVGLIPFAPSAINDAINPVKMYMYLAQGIPVVSTAISECRDNPFVATAADPEGFSRAVGRALAERDLASVEARKEFARRNTWRERAQTATRVLSDNGLLR